MNWNKLQLGVTILGAVIMALVGLGRRARAAGAEAQAQRRLKITQRQQEEAWNAQVRTRSTGRRGLLERLRSAGF